MNTSANHHSIRNLPVSKNSLSSILTLAILAFNLSTLQATETENLNIRILPPPGKVVIDGKSDDWDLSGGIFVCSDVENLRDKMGAWIHIMYDADNLYVITRWLDETPMSNPGSIAGDHGWDGDCLQLRIITRPEGVNPPPICWVTAWRDRDGKDLIDLAFPQKTHENLKDAKARGAQQAFLKNADGKGYVQEIALPWKTLIDGGLAPKPGDRINFSVEPNFNTGSNFRITMKDIFRPGVTPDRVFTFQAFRCWGYGIFQAKGNVEPKKLRMADRREFSVEMQDGKPAINWTGLYEAKKMEGFAKISLDLPEDGFVSLNIKNAEGQVVRQLLTASFMTRGDHEVLWDGLTNMSHLKPGEVVDLGDYSWEAIYHRGLGLRLVGWADNAGKAPFDSPGGNWGGDHGMPSAVTTDGNQIYLGWNGSEAGQAVVCTDLEGKVKWRHKRGGFGGAHHIAAGGDTVYVNDNQVGESVLYRLDAKKGSYIYWKGKDTAVLPIEPGLAGLDITGGKLYLSQGKGIRILDAETGAELETIAVAEPGDLEAAADGTVYVLSAGKQVLRVKADGTTEPVVTGFTNARGLAIGKGGEIYVGILDPDNQVKVFGQDGKLIRSIGKAGGRAPLGLWQPDGLRFINGLGVDTGGNLWVAEKDDRPKRISCWNGKDGSFVNEFFGPTAYGAIGGAISPVDPFVMVGSGCDWRLDPKTGRAKLMGVFHRGEMGNSRFGQSPDGRLYVAVAEGWIHGLNPVSLYERIGEGQLKLRTRFEALSETKDKNGAPSGKLTGARIWSDANDDQKEQPEEVREYKMDLGGWITGWYMPMTQSMTFYGGSYRIAPTGWTKCGAPLYDLTQSKRMPAPEDIIHRGGMGAQRGCGSQDGKLVVYNGHYNQNHSDFTCYEIESGKQKWTYPNNYVGVHGGHNAPPAQTGMIRGAYDIVGTGKLPEPIGDIFVIATDKGEWHILTGEGYYLSRLFESDPLKIKWPDNASPGAIMDSSPPGMGGEDFGGSIIVTGDGELHLQAGKTAYINIKVVGLDTVRKLKGGKLEVKESDLALARNFREKLLQQSVGIREVTVDKRSVTFTGDLRKDFGTREPLTFEKNRAARIEAAIACDDNSLYLGWQVDDATPWVNGASDPFQMYAAGDTVDFQLCTDPKSDPKRSEAVLGDLRLSIGNFQGKPTAVIYLHVATEKQPRKFFSGVIREGYEMQSVLVLKDAKIEVKIDDRNKRYTVEAAIPLKALGLTTQPGLKLTGDIGATHGDPSGTDTRLRTYWNNQSTGIVDDEVFELKMEPSKWGQLVFE
ncbi:MAG: PQQ-binding-like beta-propeller repeat protein [Planctomycetota bacterium]|nr:PQQ-binding-like beta-propeller repeat protein [Planctomycetota bacterium]MDA1139013.1 PQQ-binding-like beta-propeller repeat protein [Planctomycetota bacterium]